MKIIKYNPATDLDKIITLFESEKDWEFYLSEGVIEKYKMALENSITYVACYKDEIIGYSRSIDDNGIYIYICDLLVHKKYRGKNIGRLLLDCIIEDYPDSVIYVMSDVDAYYKKLGYKLEGSLFKVSKTPK